MYTLMWQVQSKSSEYKIMIPFHAFRWYEYMGLGPTFSQTSQYLMGDLINIILTTLTFQNTILGRNLGWADLKTQVTPNPTPLGQQEQNQI